MSRPRYRWWDASGSVPSMFLRRSGMLRLSSRCRRDAGGCLYTLGWCVVALKQVYENQAEIPAGLQEHYVEKDGKWVLQTDPQFEDVSALKGVLDQERNLRRDAEKTVTDLKVQFEGVNVEEYHKLQDRVKGLDDADVYDKQGIESLVARRTESMKAEHERQVQAKDREIVQLRGQAGESDRRWRQDRIKTALISAVSGSGVEKDALEDGVTRGLAVFNELDTEGLPIAKKGEDVVYGKDGINPLRPEEWISSLKASGTARHLWPGSSGGGAPPHHGGNGQGIDWSKLPPAERMTAFRQQQEAARNH